MKDRKELSCDIYRHLLAESIAAVNKRNLEDAESRLKRAIALDYTRPDAFNILGIIMEIRSDIPRAQSYYRAALSLDPTYTPARDNLDRSVGFRKISQWNLGEE